MQLSADQEEALKAVRRWYKAATALWAPSYCQALEEGEEPRSCPPWRHTHGMGEALAPVLSVGGLAGSGKTTIVMLLEEYLGKVNPALAAPTNKAAAVLRRKRDAQGLKWWTGTYFSLIRRPVVRYWCSFSSMDTPAVSHRCPEWSRKDGCEHSRAQEKCVCPEWRAGEGTGGDKGARCGCPHRFRPCGRHPGMACKVEQELLWERNKLLSGNHALVVVDEASMLTESDVDDLRSFGVPLLLVGDHGQLPPVQGEMNPWMADGGLGVELTENHRQVGDGRAIADLAREVRAGLRLPVGRVGQGLAVISKNDPRMGQVMERFVPGPERSVVVWTNRLRVTVNHMMRGGVHPVKVKDRVVCLRGCELVTADDKKEVIRVYNGEMGTVEQVGEATPRHVQLVVKLDDPDPERGITRPAVHTRAAVAQFGAASMMRENDPERPTGRRSEWQSWDYGYAVTAHKAQGSEYQEVLVIDESPRDYERWMYTAVTRAAKKLIVVKWNG
jgi:hypothetical protein